MSCTNESLNFVLLASHLFCSSEIWTKGCQRNFDFLQIDFTINCRVVWTGTQWSSIVIRWFIRIKDFKWNQIIFLYTSLFSKIINSLRKSFLWAMFYSLVLSRLFCCMIVLNNCWAMFFLFQLILALINKRKFLLETLCLPRP